MRTAGTAGCDRGCTRICGVDDRLVPATCSVGPLLRAGFEKRQFTISVRVSTSTGADGRLAAPLRMAWARRKLDRKSVVEGKSVSVCVHIGGRRINKKTPISTT